MARVQWRFAQRRARTRYGAGFDSRSSLQYALTSILIASVRHRLHFEMERGAATAIHYLFVGISMVQGITIVRPRGDDALACRQRYSSRRAGRRTPSADRRGRVSGLMPDVDRAALTSPARTNSTAGRRHGDAQREAQ